MSIRHRLDDLRISCTRGAKSELERQVATLRAEIESKQLSLTENDAFELLDLLSVGEMNSAAAQCAESLSRIGRDWPFLVRTSAQALIQDGQLTAAEILLEDVKRNTDDTFEKAASLAQLGRLNRSRSSALKKAKNPGADAALAAALKFYCDAFDEAKDTAQRHPQYMRSDDDLRLDRTLYRIMRWAGDNIISISEQNGDEATAQRYSSCLIQEIEMEFQGRSQEIGPFDYASLATANLSLDNDEVAATQYLAMMDHEETSLGQLQRTLRGFKEKRKVALKRNDNLRMAKHAIEAEVAQRSTQSIYLGKKSLQQIGTQSFEPSELQKQRQQVEAKNLPRHNYAIEWLRTGVNQARGIGRVFELVPEDADGPQEGGTREQDKGTGFLLDGASFGYPHEPVFVTCAHVLSKYLDGVKAPEKFTAPAWKSRARVRFEALEGKPECEVLELLHEWPLLSWPDIFPNVVFEPPYLDVTIARLKWPEAWSASDAKFCRVGEYEDLMKARSERRPGGYLIGHPEASELALTLDPADLTMRYADMPEVDSAEFIRYDVRTYAGHSGSPVFGPYWHVVAIHQRGPMSDAAAEREDGRGILLKSVLAQLAQPPEN